MMMPPRCRGAVPIHGAGGDYDFNSLLADALDADCDFVVQNEWTEYTNYFLPAAMRRCSWGCTR